MEGTWAEGKKGRERGGERANGSSGGGVLPPGAPSR